MSALDKQAPRKIAYAYARVSTIEQGAGASLATQLAGIAEYAAARGYEITQSFEEKHTGAELWERPLLDSIRTDIRARRIQALICYAVDRLARDMDHLAILFDEAERHGVELLFATEEIDQTPEGKLLRSIRGYVAQVEREKIRERTMRGRRGRLLAGKIHNAGPELYGFRRDRQRGVRLAYETEAEIVREIFQQAATGAGLLTIAKRLNAQGVPAPFAAKQFKDCLWSAATISNLIHNPNYKGETVTWRVRGKKNGSNETRPPEDWLILPPGVTPALVSPELWTQANDQLRMNKGEKRRNQNAPYLLRGHIICAVCGLRMYPMPKLEHGRGYRYYRCSSATRYYRKQQIEKCTAASVPADDCERWVWSQIAACLAAPASVTQLLANVSAHDNTPLLQEQKRAKRELTVAEQGCMRLLRRLSGTDDDLLAQTFAEELKRLLRDKETAARKLAEINAALAQEQQKSLDEESLLEYLRGVGKGAAQFDFDHQRLALLALGVQVVANGREWELQLNLPVSGASPDGSSGCNGGALIQTDAEIV